MWKPGTRIGAWLKADSDTVYLLGYGTYVGHETPPEPFGAFKALGIHSWDQFRQEAKEHTGKEIDQLPTNPKLVLDDGTVVWGAECWWGPEEKMKEKINGRAIVEVDIEKEREGANAQSVG